MSFRISACDVIPLLTFVCVCRVSEDHAEYLATVYGLWRTINAKPIHIVVMNAVAGATAAAVGPHENDDDDGHMGHLPANMMDVVDNVAHPHGHPQPPSLMVLPCNMSTDIFATTAGNDSHSTLNEVSSSDAMVRACCCVLFLLIACLSQSSCPCADLL